MSEKFHLPILNNPFSDPTIEKPVELIFEHEHRIEWKIARAFRANRYPLSKAGEKLKAEVDEALQEYDKSDKKSLDALKGRLPTVEHPRLELFAEFDLTREQELATFGPNLACVQVTKGCRHDCDHCAIDPSKKVEQMPFAAIMKINQKIEQNRGQNQKFFNEWKELIIKHLNTGPLKEAWNRLKTKKTFLSKYSNNDEYRLLELYCAQATYEGDSPEDAVERLSLHDEALRIYKSIHAEVASQEKFLTDASILEFDQKSSFGRLSSGEMPRHLTHYYDSDPFDYRDTTFLHEDGTPADYGDVFVASMPNARTIEITTAGWPKHDVIAQHGAEKIVHALKISKEENQERSNLGRNRVKTVADLKRYEELQNTNFPFPVVRVSIHPYERGTSKGNATRYREDIEQTLRTLNGVDPQLLFIKSDDENQHAQFMRDVVIPLAANMQDVPALAKKLMEFASGERKMAAVSHFSGRAKTDKQDEGNDVMACMPGIHISPDGSVTKQNKACAYTINPDTETRPQALAYNLYELNSKKRKE